MTFHIYENWRAEGHKARIHRSTCPYCNHGRGIHPEASDRNGRWHGPFHTYQLALREARATGGRVTNCRACAPE